MNTYVEMKQRHQAEVNAFPLGVAFGADSFEKMMKEWNLDPEEDLDKIIAIGGGMFIRKSDEATMYAMFARHKTERDAAIKADKDGTGFVFDMFLQAFWDTEYGYSYSSDDVLNYCGLTEKQVESSPKLKSAYEKAKEKY